MRFAKAQLKKNAYAKRILLFLGCIFSLITFMWNSTSDASEIDLYLGIFIPSLFLGLLILLISQQIVFEIKSGYLFFSETPGFWDQKSNSKVPISEITDFRVIDGKIHFSVFNLPKSVSIEEYECITENGGKISWQKLGTSIFQNSRTTTDGIASEKYLESVRKKKFRGMVVTLFIGALTIFKIYRFLN